MKYLLFIIAALCLVSCSENTEEELSTYQIVNYPNPEIVISHLLAHVPNACANCAYDLDKTPEGYTFNVISLGTENETLESHLIWSAESQEFLAFEISDDYLLNNTTSNFNQVFSASQNNKSNLYYGYEFANTDVIKALEDKKDKSNIELEQLARAYDVLACSYIHPKWNTKNASTAFFDETNFEPIKKERIDLFVKNADKALAAYEKIIDNDPEYETIVGKVGIKHANLCVHYYNNLFSVKETELAEKYFARVNYPSEIIDFAKNTLSLCKENGILFTTGDNDSFPLWFIQKQEKFRPDVLVLNENFLTLPYYITILNQTQDLKTTLSGQDLFDSELAYAFLKGTDTTTYFFTDFVTHIKNNINDVEDFHLKSVAFGNKFTIKYKDTLLPIKIPNSYALTSEILQFDIISSNPERPVYFMSNNFQKYELNNYVSQRSMVKELTTATSNIVDSLTIAYLEKDIEELSINKLNQLDKLSAGITLSIAIGMMELESNNPKKVELYLKMLDKVSFDKLIENDNLYAFQHFIYCKPEDSESYSYPKDEIDQKLIDYIESMNITQDNVYEQIDKLAIIDKTLRLNFFQNNNDIKTLNNSKLVKKLLFKLTQVSKESWMEGMLYSENKIRNITKQY